MGKSLIVRIAVTSLCVSSAPAIWGQYYIPDLYDGSWRADKGIKNAGHYDDGYFDDNWFYDYYNAYAYDDINPYAWEPSDWDAYVWDGSRWGPYAGGMTSYAGGANYWYPNYPESYAWHRYARRPHPQLLGDPYGYNDDWDDSYDYDDYELEVDDGEPTFDYGHGYGDDDYDPDLGPLWMYGTNPR